MLRDHALPATLGRVSGISYAVTGITAGNHDFTVRLHSRVPVVFAFVLGLAFLLLMVTFRSVAIPLMSIGLNLDYHVFILSRIRELRLRGMATPEAITGGIGASAGVVTSAAVIMVAV